jgi:4-hydroxy-tetrahydrodipicolinate synthase
MFQGAFTALLTPFKKDGSIDERAFQSFIEWQIAEGIEGLVPCGSTGEAATMTEQERKRVISLCVEAAGHRVPVIAGTGTNCTASTIEMTKFAQQAGADGALVVVPYYNKPMQEGLYQHFKAVNDAVNFPVVMYNVPTRTGRELAEDTVIRLSYLDNIVGIKDATADLSHVPVYKNKAKKGFCQLSGEDALAVGYLAQGGDGIISVSSNIAPKMVSDVQKAWRKKEWSTVETLQSKLADLHKAMFIETNPMPVKYAFSLMKKGEGVLRLPLVEVKESSKKFIEDVLKELGCV